MVKKNMTCSPDSFPIHTKPGNFQEHYWHLQALAPNANYLIDSSMKIITVNITGAAMLGGLQADLCGYDFQDYLHQDSKDLFDFHKNSLLRTGSTQVCELRLVKKDGRNLTVHMIAVLVPTHDKNSRIRLFMNNITGCHAQKTNLELNESCDAILPDFISRFLPDGTLTYVNQPLCRLMNIPFKELIGQKFFKFLHKKTAEKIIQTVGEISLVNPVAVHEQEFDMFETGIRCYQWMNYGIFDDTGSVIEYHGLGRDITKFKHSQFKEKKARSPIINQDTLSLGLLSGNVIHEIKNILGGISLFTDVLSDPEKYYRTDEEKEIFNEIKGCINKGNTIFKQLSNFSKSTDYSLEMIDIKKFIERNWKLWQLIVKKRNLQLNAEIDGNLLYVNGNQSGMQQVLTSLITNAAGLYPKKGVIHIMVSKEKSFIKPHQEMVFLKVMTEDTIILTEQLEKIFKYDFKASAKKGSIDLYLSNQIVKKLGGSLYLKKNKHKGAIFVVELPLFTE